MPKTRRILSIATLIIAFLSAPFIISCTSTRPDNLGPKNSALNPCPQSPNCVCSFEKSSDDLHYISPLRYTGAQGDARRAILEALKLFPRTKIIVSEENYFYAESRTQIMRFIDDVEILIRPDTKEIHFRSASRLGYSDFGKNRSRINELKKIIAAQLKTK